MKSLTLLRHAKSAWDDAVTRDFDRPLNGKGRKAAARMGRYMRDEELAFDCVVASPALRVQQTIAGVEDGYGQSLKPAFDRRIYMASAATLLDLVQGLDDGCARALLIGHNPGLEDLVLSLASASPYRDEVEVKYPTATLAEMSFEVDRWADLAEGGERGTLIRFKRPRELDPTLGPDDT